MVASPANPTGEILTAAQLRDLQALCEKKQGHLIVDEIYHGLNYGVDAPSILAMTDKAFVINSFSKYFGMTGWRLGWLVAPEEAVPHFEPDTRVELNRRRDEFAARRDYLLPALRDLGFDIPHCPAGALYLYAGIERFKTTSQRLCLDLLENHGIAITPGEDFGRYKADQHVRFAYTTGLDRLEEAVSRLRRLYG